MSGQEGFRLQGYHTWPFEIRLPEFVINGTERINLPPSFALVSSDSYTRGAEVASVKYYVKCSMARQVTTTIPSTKTFKFNATKYRAFLDPMKDSLRPLYIYIDRRRPEMSPLRALALAESTPFPGEVNNFIQLYINS